MDLRVVVCNAGAHYVSVDLGVTHPICFLSRILRLVSLGSSRVITPSAGVGGRNPSWNLANSTVTRWLGSNRGGGGAGRQGASQEGFPGGSVVKNLPASAGEAVGFLRREFPWWGKWQPSPVFLPGESHGQRTLVGYTVHGVAKSQTRLSD